MALSDVGIINKALGNLGHTLFLDSLDEQSNEAAVATVYYDPAVEFVLADFSWGFARTYDTLGLVEEDPNDEWRYSYRYPVDRVMVRRIVTVLGRQDPNPPPFVIGADETSKLVYTDQADAVAETTKLVTDTSLFPPMFNEALAWWLAGLMAPGLAKDVRIAGVCLQMYALVMARAKAADGNESQFHREVESEAIRARE